MCLTPLGGNEDANAVARSKGVMDGVKCNNWAIEKFYILGVPGYFALKTCLIYSR